MIRLSPKYGLNPAIPKCYYCLNDKNEIVIPGLMRGKAGYGEVEAPKGAVWDKNPCDACAKWMQKGCIFISIRDGETKSDNPHRTGNWSVISDAGVERLGEALPRKLVQGILDARVAFIEDTVWRLLGFPTENIEPKEDVSH